MKIWYVYFMESKQNNKIYVGKTSKEPLKRVHEHNSGSNVWSKNNKPFKLVYYEKYFCKEDVAQREKFYKTGLGREIKKIITNHIKTIGA